MKWQRSLGWSAIAVGAMALGAGSWLGCSDDDTVATPGVDGGGASDAPSGQDTGTAADTGTQADAGVSTVPSCAAYCDTVTANCKSNPADQFPADIDGGFDAGNQQWSSKDACLRACATMTPGIVADETATGTDTVACRQYHAGAAAGNAKVHCPHASLAGGGLCSGKFADGGVDRCVSFCKAALALCTTDAGLANPASVPFASEAECLGKCGTDSYRFNPTKPEQLTTGDNLNCRQYHLNAAYSAPPTSQNLHCAHLKSPAPGTCE